MDAIAATQVLRPQPTRIAPALEEERTPPASVAATGGDVPPPQNPKFSDVVAILNPLQNLPIVGTIYRQLTNDVPHPAARALGGLLWGGPLGLVGAIFSYVAEQVSGKSTTEIVKSIFDGGGEAPSTALAATSSSGDGKPRSLLPAGAAAGQTPPLMPMLAAATAAPAPAATAAQPAPAPGASELRPRSAATRDLAFYQAHAGAKLPAASGATAPSGGPQAATQLPSFQRPVTPVLGTEPIGAAAAAQPQGLQPVSPQDFLQRMMRGIDQYQALNRSLEAQPRAARLDRVE